MPAFDPNIELDRPDLNKCPDCKCYFPGDHCPLCGKECPPVAAGISEDEYRSRCAREDPETLARNCNGREKEFVSLTLTVTEKTTDDTNDSKYDTVYICTDEQSGARFLVCDCKGAVGVGEGLLPGDTVTVYGQIESAWYTFCDGTPESTSAPCIAMAYSDRLP